MCFQRSVVLQSFQTIKGCPIDVKAKGGFEPRVELSVGHRSSLEQKPDSLVLAFSDGRMQRPPRIFLTNFF
jgi:hypothetical protein